MKKWMLCTLALGMTACSQSGGLDAGKAGAYTCNVPAMQSTQMSTNVGINPASVSESSSADQTDSATPSEIQDPFAAGGKVILSGGESAVGGIGIQSASSSGSVVRAGTEISITLDQSCQEGGAITTSVRAAELAAVGALPTKGTHSFTYVLPADITKSQLKKTAEADACVVGISNSFKSFTTALPTDPMANQQAHLATLEAAAGYELVASANVGKAPVVAVIDTGMDIRHSDLKNVLWVNKGEIAGNGRDDDSNGYVDDVNGYNFAQRRGSPQHTAKWAGYQHGTHVAGLAAAQSGNGVGVAGIATAGTKVMALNVFGDSSGAYSSDIANAIRYAVDNGADIINLSLGGVGRSAAYESALAYAIKNGAMVVAAAGNERREVGPDYFMSPGAYGPQFTGMMTAASIDSVDMNISNFSNYSPLYVEIAAPGADNSKTRTGLLSTFPGNSYSRLQGTSMSSPVVAGAAAMVVQMMRARGYEPGPATIEGILAMSSKTLGHLRTKVRSGRSLNLKNVAQYISMTYPAGGNGADPGAPGYQPCAM